MTLQQIRRRRELLAALQSKLLDSAEPATADDLEAKISQILAAVG